MKTFVLFLFVLMNTLLFAQSDSPGRVESWIPKELKGEMLYVEKYSEISTDESLEIVGVNSNGSLVDKYLQNIDEFNLVVRRKMNSQIQSTIDQYSFRNLAQSSARDIRENFEDNIRFILKAEYTLEEIIKGHGYNPRFYIFDQEENVRYKSFNSLNTFLESFDRYNWFAEYRITDDMEQSLIDDYVEKSIPKERKRLMSRTTRNTILVVLGTLAINVVSIVIANS